MRTVFRYVIGFVLVSGVFFLLMDKVVMQMYVSHDHTRYLPDVRGLSFEKAEERLQLEGFDAVRGDVKFTDNYAPGTVIDQYPKALRRVKPGRRIRLTVTEREKLMAVPDVVGRSMRSARLEIEEARLTIDSLMTEYDSEVPRNVIKWQHPRPGDYLRPGSGLTLIMSLGKPPDFYQVPQLFGLSLDQAKELLREARLEVGRITYRQNEDLLPNTVLDQSIEAETILDHTVAVDLTVSILDLDDIYKSLSGRE